MSGPYSVIYADCPWSYKNVRTGGSMTSGAAQKYPVISTADLCRLPVRELAASNSALFLWGTVPMLPDAFEVLRAWGFTYKTMLTWVKTGRLGMGHYFRGNTEHLLVGVRGKALPFRLQMTNYRLLAGGRHSGKPPEFRTIVEMAAIKLGVEPPAPYGIELFATEHTPGWDAWGMEVESDITLEVPSHA